MPDTTTVTVLFTDVVGSTGLRQRVGETAAECALHAHNNIVRDQIGRAGGREVKTSGDGFMVAFDSTRKAVDCAIAIQKALADRNRAHPGEQVVVRIGINAGEATEEQGDLFGASVNAAKYIQDKARPGEILIPATVKTMIGPVKDITFVDRGYFRLKGFPERWRLYEVAWGEEGATAPACAERTPFVGRETERAELRRLLEDALRGQGALAMISGEPGVGKTRLAEELAAEARERGGLALIGHCYEMEKAPPYIPFVEIFEAANRVTSPKDLREALGDAAPEVARVLPELRRLFPDIPPPLELPPEQERRFLFSNLRAYLARIAAARPLFLVLDDLHWADDATLLLLEHIAQALHDLPVLIVGTYRDMELEVVRPLARALEDLIRRHLVHDLSLKPLAEAGVADILKGLSGRDPPSALVKIIYDETEGNPFFVEEVFKYLSEEGRLFDPTGKDWSTEVGVGELDVPRGVRLVIERRLDRVGENCRRVLTAAAVIGRAFTFELLQALVDVGEDELLNAVDEAERARLIASGEEREARFSFVHQLIRQTLLGGMTLPRRQRMHARVAEALDETYAATLDDHVSDLAYHLSQAGVAADPRKTVRYLARAGEQALTAAAFEEALRLYQDALIVQPSDDHTQRAGLLYKRGLARRSLGQWDDAIADWQEALAIYEASGDSEEVGRVSFETCYQLAYGGRFVEVLDVARRGLAALGDRVNVDRCRLLSMSGAALCLGNYHEAGAGMIEQALAMSQQLKDRRLLGEGLASKAVLHWAYMQLPQALDHGCRAAELLRTENNLWRLSDILWVMQFVLLELGRFDDVAAIDRELHPLAERLGNVGAVIMARRHRGQLQLMRAGDIDAFEELANADLELGRSSGFPWFSQAITFLGLVNFWRGRWQEAVESFSNATKLECPGFTSGSDWGFLFLGAAYAGDEDSALDLLERKRGDLPCACRPNSIGAWEALLAVVEGLTVLDLRSEAAKLYPLVLEAIDNGAVVHGFGSRLFQTAAGLSAAAARQWEKAQEHYETALRQAHELPVVIEQPEVRRFYALMLIERDGPGDRERAHELLTEAVAMYRAIGMPKHVEIVEMLLPQWSGACGTAEGPAARRALAARR